MSVNEMFQMQYKLNCRIGRDTLNPVNIAIRTEWSQDYCIALVDEMTELLNCLRWKWWDKEVQKDPSRRDELINKENAKIEAIDSIHFVISLCQLNNISASIFKEYFENDIKPSRRIKHYIFRIIYHCTQVIEHPYTINISTILNHILSNLCNVCKCLDMTLDDVCELYMKKNQVNFERQERGYDSINKTEEDNLKIIEELKK